MTRLSLQKVSLSYFLFFVHAFSVGADDLPAGEKFSGRNFARLQKAATIWPTPVFCPPCAGWHLRRAPGRIVSTRLAGVNDPLGRLNHFTTSLIHFSASAQSNRQCSRPSGCRCRLLTPSCAFFLFLQSIPIQFPMHANKSMMAI